nr:hypothetical protein [Tanacetum cinerariifolium]
MDDQNLTMEEYIELEAEKARKHGQTFNWETATYGKVRYHEDIYYFKDFKTDFPVIAYENALTYEPNISSEPTISPFDNNQIDFRISFDESDDKDYTIIYDKNSLSYKIIYVNNLKTDSKIINEVNIPSNDVVIEQLDNGIPTPREMAISIDARLSMEHTDAHAQAHEKVTNTDLYFLRSVNQEEVNLPYLMAYYLFRHADGRKHGAQMSRGHFITCLVDHFGLLIENRLQGTTVVATTAEALEVVEGAHANEEGVQAVPATIQAPQPPPPATTRTMP